MASPFNYLTWAQAQQEVALRLGDENFVFWTAAEIATYLKEAMQVWNCLTAYWAVPYNLTFGPTPGTTWLYANVTGSPRAQTATDSDVYVLIQNHLLEPPVGGNWTGTDQFSLNDLTQAMSRRRNEILQASACNLIETIAVLTPNTNSVTLEDTILDVRRVRWVPVAPGSPVTLQRGDTRSFQYYTPAFAQSTLNPLRWDVIGSPPQVITLDTNVNQPSFLQVLGIEGADDFPAVPVDAMPLLIPDDWAWVLKFGAMADILTKEQEGRDLERSVYCSNRYVEGMKLMAYMPWLLQAFINGVAVDTQSLSGADRYNYEWESRPGAFPEIVVAGIDTFALSPVPTTTMSVTLKVVGNAPIPVLGTDEIQVPRDVLNSVLDEAQHLALFKMGGQEFKESMTLHQGFIKMALRTNQRLQESGIFSSTIRPQEDRQDADQPRYAVTKGR